MFYFYGMSFSLRILILYFFLIPAITFAQDNILDKPINIEAQNVTAKSLLEIIKNDYGIHFTYNDNILPQTKIALSDHHNIKLSQFLNEYLDPFGIAFKSAGNQVILYQSDISLRNIVISGFIVDFETQENLIGVTLYLNEEQRGTTTNSYGYFNINTKPGKQNLLISYIGYKDTLISLEITGNYSINLPLKPVAYSVEEVSVIHSDTDETVHSMMMNTNRLGIATLRSIPGLFGENDVLRNISVLPGITQNEISSGNINVRGGSSDQTLFLMDEAKLYNAGHFGGFFSVFNPDIVNNVQVFKADLPVYENGAISSLIDVKLKEGNKEKWKIKGGLGLIDAKASVEGPIKKDKTSMIIAFRRTYIDAIANLIREGLEPADLNFYFYDLNLKINSTINSKNRVYFSGYTGTDVFVLNSELKRSNYVGTLRWNHIFNSKLFLNTSVIASRNYMHQNTSDFRYQIRWWRQIHSLETKFSFNYLINSRFRFNYGLNAILTDFDPYYVDPLNSNSIYTNEKGHTERLLTSHLFLEARIKISNRISSGIGGRLGYFINPYGNLHTNEDNNSSAYYSGVTLEPHLFLKYQLSKQTALKASYNHQVNPLHQLQVSDIGITINRWMPANKEFTPAKSYNYSIGLYSTPFKGVKAIAEVYYRDMHNLIETFQDNRILFTPSPHKFIRKSNGKAYGAELMFSLNRNRYTGIFSYSYQVAKWETDGVNSNTPYPANHNRPHSLNIINSIAFSQRVNIGISWNYATGTPFTPVSGTYRADGKDIINLNDKQVNSFRLPNYHRLDIGVNIAGKKNHLRRWKGFWNISVYNAYFRKNALSVAYYTPSETESSDETTIQLNPKYMYLYQFVPSISYRFEF